MDTRIYEGSGNIFADLGLSDADELLAKAELTSRIAMAIERRGLTRAAAAELMDLPTTEAADLLRGRWEVFPVERLSSLLARLDEPRRRG